MKPQEVLSDAELLDREIHQLLRMYKTSGKIWIRSSDENTSSDTETNLGEHGDTLSNDVGNSNSTNVSNKVAIVYKAPLLVFLDISPSDPDWVFDTMKIFNIKVLNSIYITIACFWFTRLYIFYICAIRLKYLLVIRKFHRLTK